MKIIAAVTAILMTSATAYAADAIIYEEPAAVVADTFSWTGGYIGLNAGYAGGKLKNAWNYYSADIETTSYSDNINHNGSGFVGGIQAGYNWQMNQVVFGLETDIQASGIKADAKNVLWGFDSNNSTNASVDVHSLSNKISWFGTTRARIGYTPVDRFLVYATAGVAYGKVKSSLDATFLGSDFKHSRSKTNVGYAIGAGAEYAFTDNWTIKSEYLYTDLGKIKFSGSAIYADGPTVGSYKGSTKFNFHTVRIGLNYKF